MKTISTVCALCLSVSVAAQTDESWRIEKISVVGDRSTLYQSARSSLSKSNVDMQFIPQSMHVLNQALLNDQQLQNLSAALFNVSGLVPNDSSETLLINPLARGFESEIFIDGLMGYGDTAVIDPSSLIGIERIEIAKGPTSSLYGGGTGAPVGGLINLVSKSAEQDNFTRIGARAGSFALNSLWLDTNHGLTSDIAVRLAAEHRTNDDYIHHSEQTRTLLYPALAWQVNERFDIAIKGFYTHVEQTEYTGLSPLIAYIEGVDRFQTTSAKDAPPSEIKNQSAHVTFEYLLSDFSQINLQIRHYNSSFDEYAAWRELSVPLTASALDPSKNTVATHTAGGLLVDVQESTLDLTYSHGLTLSDSKHSLLIGITLDQTQYDGRFTERRVLGELDYLQPEMGLSFGQALGCCLFTANNEYETRALYGQNHITFDERWHVLLSARYSQYKIKEAQSFGVSVDSHLEHFDPRVGLTYAASDHLSYFVGLATGSRLPLFFGANANSPELEKSESAEIGLKFDLPTTGLKGSASLYYLLRSNIPTADPNNLFQQIQGGEQKGTGIELDIIWEPAPQLSVLANMNVSDAVVTEAISSFSGVVAVGNRLARVPKHSFQFASHYRFDGRWEGLEVGASFSFRSDAPLTDGNLYFADSYSKLDATMAYQWSKWRLSARLENLLNQDYFLPFQYFSQDYLRPGAPRQIQLGVEYEF